MMRFSRLGQPAIHHLAAALVLVVIASPLPAHRDARDRVHQLNHLIEESPGEAELYIERALALVDEGRIDEALLDVDRARERGGDSLSTALVEATALLAAQRPETAVEVLAAAQAIAPENIRLLRLRARAYRQQGKWGAAAADLETVVATSLRPSADLVLELSRDLRAADRARDALHRVDEALLRAGASTALRREVIAIELELGNLDAALRRLDQWSATDRFPARWRVDHALLLEAAGRWSEAGTSWRAAETALTDQLRRFEGTPPAPLLDLATAVAAGRRRTDSR